ncbi:hypothetical protein SUDANB145_07222 (plasmid) [Streptomyces sp. enrichment culture]|uniref:hypothetical protein n=1 Tax=Streptomyces sp. enrichment culture TaxID=1795815 RepID=UPI003F542FE0
MTTLPEPRARQPHAPQAGQPDLDTQAQQLLNAVNEALATPTRYRDETPVPTVGTAPPVPQPGRPPMSQKATDASALMLSGGLASLPIGAAATGILWASGNADPVVIAIICAAPTTLILALSRLMRRTKETVAAAPPVIHKHYNGAVYQDNRQNHVDTRTSGLIAHTRNELPR